MYGVFELLILMFLGLIVLVPAVIAFVVISNRRTGRPVPPDFAPGSLVVSSSGDQPDPLVGRLVRTDNEHAVIEIDGVRRFVLRSSLRPAADRSIPQQPGYPPTLR